VNQLRDSILAYERKLILEALAVHNHNVIRTARALGINRTHLYKRIARLKIKLLPSKFRNEGNAAWRALEDAE
jgi:DNA-binding NtrC family response regulator